MAEPIVAGLVRLLDVEEIDRDLYRGARKPGGIGRVFGGQVIAQALVSAQRSIDDDKKAHSLHAYFLRGGDEDLPIVFRVVRDFDGRSFANRRIIAMQRGRPILNMAASFHRSEDGFAHAGRMPDVPAPETLPTQAERVAEAGDRLSEGARAFLLRPWPIEIRALQPLMPGEGGPAQQGMWFRAAGPIGADADLHRAVLAYASDMGLLGTSLRPHGRSWESGDAQVASLDHALWFHDVPRADEWMLYACDSPWAGHARGFNRGAVYARDGRLIASVAQEGLVRPVTRG